MKETTKMSRAVGQLEKIYNTLNTDLFGGALPVPIITVQSKPGTYGHCTTSKVWKNKDSQQYEMNIAAEMLSMEIEEVLDTLIHEMVWSASAVIVGPNAARVGEEEERTGEAKLRPLAK